MPVRDKHGKLITSEQQIQERWNEHFNEDMPEPTEIAEIPEAEIDLEISTEIHVPSKIEIIKAIMSIKNNKASGNNQLPAEVFKSDPSLSADIIHSQLCKIWDNDIIPTTWFEGNVIILPKKGDLTNCNNWGGITLLSIRSKIFSKIIIARIKTAVDNKLRSEQTVFRKGRGCCDQVFVLRNIIEQCREKAKSVNH